MSYLLAIETSTKNCSVAVFQNQNILSYKEECEEKFSHSEKLTSFIEAAIYNSNIEFNQLNAIAVGSGPGSYTGLRIGASIAKGLCYSLDIPLISICSLDVMAYSVMGKYKYDLYCPMIDAKRMEVYSALYTNQKKIRKVKAEIITKDSFRRELEGSILFFGDGAIKCKEIISHENANFMNNINPSARDMIFLCQQKFKKRDFEDLAYYEPKYLKDFLVNK